METNDKRSLSEKYSSEIAEIAYILKNLEAGRIYENTGARMDGSLATNVAKLREKIAILLSKIENNDESFQDKFDRHMSEFEI
ncbi:hypothetical protein ACQCVK_02855 [Rossellomorea vietnamensis]|uniref:hypothetical protein n=1 Tax=Rossellomorea vietnamensis TaxID=218284 RepID=UPI003CEF5610